MRLFIAIEISKDVQEAIALIQAHLKYASADVKWVAPLNIHLTLKFLGEVKEEKVEMITSVLNDSVKWFSPFEIDIKDIGAFPTIEFPKVVWAGLNKGADQAKRLADTVDEKLTKIGFQKESRPFAAHLTLGRVRSGKNKDALKEKMLSYSLLPIPYTLVRSIALMQSALTPQGPIYRKINEASLSGTPASA